MYRMTLCSLLFVVLLSVPARAAEEGKVTVTSTERDGSKITVSGSITVADGWEVEALALEVTPENGGEVTSVDIKGNLNNSNNSFTGTTGDLQAGGYNTDASSTVIKKNVLGTVIERKTFRSATKFKSVAAGNES